MSIYSQFGDKGGVLQACSRAGSCASTTTSPPRSSPSAPTTPAEALELLRRSAHTYRAFALASPGTYALMFEAPADLFEVDDACLEEAGNAFFALLQNVEQAQQAGAIVEDGAGENSPAGLVGHPRLGRPPG
ncbi:MAG: TetR-like C-terminal domain-containing protein [Acidimicrobiales bacterium]